VKKGSAKERMFNDLRKKAGMAVEEQKTDDKAAKPNETATADRTAENQNVDKAADRTADPAAATATAEAKDKRVNPWKLVDEHKSARAKLEAEVAELRKSIPDPAKSKEVEERISALSKRNEELESHIRFVDYSKSAEFADKYQKPYTQAWQRWMADLNELTVQGQDGTERPIQPNDILQLINMPLQKAREAAEEAFGPFADDVMSARKEIRSLFDAQQRALEEARKSGKEHFDAQSKAAQEAQANIAKEVSEVWTAANQTVVTDEAIAKWFKPVDGDEEGNKRLKSGYEMADRAFSVSPLDPNLTKEQRAEIVQLHAAVRNRSAAFGRLTFQNAALEKQIAELRSELEKFKSIEPGGGQQRSEQNNAQAGGTAMDRMRAKLRTMAH